MNVRTERRPGVLLVGIDRPAKRNAIDLATVDELHAVLDAAVRDDPAVLVLHSTTPGMFVAGADLAELVERDADDALQAINAGLFEKLEAYRWPSIAAVGGPALGGGCELALACDLRVASSSARFAQHDHTPRRTEHTFPEQPSCTGYDRHAVVRVTILADSAAPVFCYHRVGEAADQPHP